MAREIHDDLGQQLTALKLDHSWILRRFEMRDRTGVAEQLADMDHLLDTAVATVQRLATDLRPHILDELRLLAALEWQACRGRAAFGDPLRGWLCPTRRSTRRTNRRPPSSGCSKRS